MSLGGSGVSIGGVGSLRVPWKSTLESIMDLLREDRQLLSKVVFFGGFDRLTPRKLGVRCWGAENT